MWIAFREVQDRQLLLVGPAHSVRPGTAKRLGWALMCTQPNLV
jgi:hypothetical protein